MLDSRFNKYLAPGVTVGLLMALGGTACGSKQANCLSPAAESRAYPGDRAAHGSDPSQWPHGILIKTKVPRGTEGVVLGFEVPGTDHWKRSKPVPPNMDEAVALRIGPGPVEFSTQIEAKTGSGLCQETPETAFSDSEPYSEASDQSSGYVPSENSWSYSSK